VALDQLLVPLDLNTKRILQNGIRLAASLQSG
jgi:hypothetical protein